jgi:hypothetical protein
MIIKAIDEYLQNRPKDERATRCFHPSVLHRPAEYLFKAYFDGDCDQGFPSRVLRIFDNGNGVHRRLQRYLERIGILKQAEVRVENSEYEIKGHTDGIIEVGGKEGVLEIKSINSSGFFSLHEPKPEHLIQLNVYMFCLDIPRGCLLYECKDNQELKEFFLKADPKVLKRMLEKIKTVQRRIKDGQSGGKV